MSIQKEFKDMINKGYGENPIEKIRRQIDA